MTTDKTHLSRAERIKSTLVEQFAPSAITLDDESGKHIGHAGARPKGETHYRLCMVAPVFDGLSRVARQRLVYAALREEFDTGLHALSLDLKTPQEARS